jgi:predicted heme/steroid binding protein
MSVKKIFITLIIIVACVIIGALVLNKLVPNATTALVNAVEGQIYNATGMSFDFNGDNSAGGGSGQDYSSAVGNAASDAVKGVDSNAGVTGIGS